MDWNLIKVFLAVCEAGSQVEAARRTGLSHATVFRRIAALEKDVGARLFERIKGRHVLTDAGTDLREISRGLAASFEEIERRIAGRDVSASGLVRLTAPRSFAEDPLPRYLQALSAAHPDITIELLVSNQELNMSDRSADLALRVGESPPEQLWGRRLVSIDWAVYAAPGYLAAGPRLDGLEDLRRRRLIAPAGQLLRHPAYRSILSDPPPLAPVRCDDLTTMARLAAAGLGAALLPDDLARPPLVRCFAYAGAPPNTLWALTHPDLRGVKRITLTMGFLANAFAGDPIWRRNG